MNKIINIDWLQLNCKGILTIPNGFNIKILPYSTRVFRKIIEVYKNERLLFTIACEPLSPVIPKDTHIIKFDNKILYDFDFHNIVDDATKKFGIKFKSITRIDICMDFNYFDCNMGGYKFIENFCNNKYYHASRSNFKLQGRQDNKNYYEYLRFGSNTSPTSVYLYNKTLEMKKVKMKQHIIKCWQMNDLDIEKDIWRLEFSIKTSKVCIVDEIEGEITHITLDDLRNINFLNHLFYALVRRYFTFYRKDTFISKKKSKPILLFNEQETHHCLHYYTSEKDTNRSDKVFIKRLEQYNNELRSTKKHLVAAMEEIKFNYIQSRNLTEYYSKIVNPFY